MRAAIFICAVLAFAAVVQEGLAKPSKKKLKQLTQSDGIITKLPRLAPSDPLWIQLKQIIEDNISDVVYVLVIYQETFGYTSDVKYIIFMNNENDATLYRLSVVFIGGGPEHYNPTLATMTLDDGEDA